MKVAVPLEGGLLCTHFGHSKRFAIFEVDPDDVVRAGYSISAIPEGGHDLLAGWMKGHGVTLVISGGIGTGAVQRLNMAGIKIAASDSPQGLGAAVRSWMRSELTARVSTCSCSANRKLCGHHDHAVAWCQ